MGQDGGLAKQGKVVLRFFSCESDFLTEVVFAFRFVPSFLAVCGRSKIKKHVSVCPWCWEPRSCVPVGHSISASTAPTMASEHKGVVRKWPAIGLLHVVQPPAVVHSQRDTTRLVMSQSDGFVGSDVLWDRSFATSAVTHTLAKEK